MTLGSLSSTVLIAHTALSCQATLLQYGACHFCSCLSTCCPTFGLRHMSCVCGECLIITASFILSALQAYPGRASMSPLLDVLITLLQWGADGWNKVLQQREGVYR